jgi:hypothetical protein
MSMMARSRDDSTDEADDTTAVRLCYRRSSAIRGTASLDFYRTPPRGWCDVANALVSLMMGFLRQDPKRT